MEEGKTAEPKEYENKSQNKEHGIFFFLGTRVVAHGARQKFS